MDHVKTANWYHRYNASRCTRKPLEPKANGNLNALIQLLVAAIPIGYIFCLERKTSRIRLLVVLDPHKHLSFDEIENFINLAMLGFPDIKITYHAYGSIYDLLIKGHIFFSAVCKPQNCLYKKYTLAWLPKMSSDRQVAAIERALTLFKYNIGKVEHFLNGVEYCLQNSQSEMAAFMLHQACEQTYRLMLLIFRGREYKSHDLKGLKNHLNHYIIGLTGIFDPSNKKENLLLDILQEAYIKARYDHTYYMEKHLVIFFQEKTKLLIEKTKDIIYDCLYNIIM